MREPDPTEEYEDMTPDQFVAAVKALHFRKTHIVQAAAAVLFKKMSYSDAAEHYGCQQPHLSATVKKIRDKLLHLSSPGSSAEPMELACFLLKPDQLQLVRKIEEENLKMLLSNKDAIIERYELSDILTTIDADGNPLPNGLEAAPPE
ncbi:MAG: hypothetical protein P8Y42_22655 [Exilibacterium sp.]